jgi:excisionase family DNA binding protein
MSAPKDRKPLPSDVSSRLYTKIEIAKLLRKSPRTVDIWMADGTLPFLKVGKSVLFSWPAVLAKLQTYREN